MSSIRSNPYHHNVVPDRFDLRDRPYRPPLRLAPPARYDALRDRKQAIALARLDQKSSSAATGFALATVIDFLLHDSGRGAEAAVSPFMLYSMARRYDEFPDNDPGLGPEYQLDLGSSLRGAIKGWYKHGACAAALWGGLPMPTPRSDPQSDWWQDAVKRPLGAYYRIDARSVTDMQLALLEVGVLYASATCHAGWDAGFGHGAGGKQLCIPLLPTIAADGGQAFAIVGYDENGFSIVNSWGESWGDGGFATLQYEDWLRNGMDCWVAQLGVVTRQHVEIAEAPSLRLRDAQQVVVSGEPVLRNREIAPFVVDMENDGRLSGSGEFRTNEDDLRHLATRHLQLFRQRWGLEQEPVDVAIYAHGGLVGESAAALAAAEWIPALYQHKIFPIFLMWETDLLATLKNQLEDAVARLVEPSRGFGDALAKWWNERLERTLARPGSLIWSQMKQNARAISHNPDSGANKLYALCQQVEGFKRQQIRLHLIGHSAGAIVHCHLVDALSADGFTFESVNFLAPAVRVNVFEDTLLPAIKKGKVRRYNQFHLSDEIEQKDPTCKPILGYSRSLLFLVSESFEGGKRTPILGMQRYFDQLNRYPSIRAEASPGTSSAATTHGAFDDDAKTRESVIRSIKG